MKVCPLFLIFFMFFECSPTRAESEEWLRKDDVHRRLDELVSDLWRGSKEDSKNAIKTIEQGCLSKNEFAYFYCHTAGLVYCRKKELKPCERWLDRAIQLNPSFVEAINSYRMFLPGRVSPHLPEGPRHFEMAVISAEAKDKEKTLLNLQKAIYHKSAPRELIEAHPSFAFIRNEVFYRKLVDAATPSDKESVIMVGLKINPLHRIIDASYTREVHRKKPDASRALYHYYRAESHLSSRRYTSASRGLLDFVNLVEAKNIDLARHTILFLWQAKKYSSLKRNTHFRQWIFTKAQAYKVDTSWLKKL